MVSRQHHVVYFLFYKVISYIKYNFSYHQLYHQIIYQQYSQFCYQHDSYIRQLDKSIL